MRNDIPNFSNLRSLKVHEILLLLGKLAIAAIMAVGVCFGVVRWQESQAHYWHDFTYARYDRLYALPEIAIGDVAHVSALKAKDGAQTIDLAKVVQEKPVALVFGSYT